MLSLSYVTVYCICSVKPEYYFDFIYIQGWSVVYRGGSVAEWLACWTQAQKGPGSNRSHDAVG